MRALAETWQALLLSGRFLTRWPFPAGGDASARRYAEAAPYYPLIGLLLGVVLAGVALGARWLGIGAAGTPALAALVLLVWVWSTGALHLDGLADCADAWVGGLGDRERTFAILKDPHTGSMGVVALVLLLLTKLAALVTLLDAAPQAPLVHWDGLAGLTALLWLPVLARAQILWLALSTPAARPEGLGAALGAHLPRRRTWLSATVATGAALLGIGCFSVPAALTAAATAMALLLVWRRSLLVRLGGYTGDGVGTLVELTEALSLLAAALVVAHATAP